MIDKKYSKYLTETFGLSLKNIGVRYLKKYMINKSFYKENIYILKILDYIYNLTKNNENIKVIQFLYFFDNIVELLKSNNKFKDLNEKDLYNTFEMFIHYCNHIFRNSISTPFILIRLDKQNITKEYKQVVETMKQVLFDLNGKSENFKVIMEYYNNKENNND